MTSDGSGGAYIAWSDERDFSATGSHVFGSHVTGDGTIPPSWPADGLLLSRSVSSQMVYGILPDGHGAALAYWGDYDNGADDIRAQRMVLAGVAATEFEFRGADVSTDRVTIHWKAPSATGFTATVQRYLPVEGWRDLGGVVPAADGSIVFTDSAVEMGVTYVYRLFVVTADEVSHLYGTVSVTIPLKLRLLSRSPNPSRDMPVFQVTFATGQRARFDMFDVSGRSAWSQDLTGLGPGTHDVRPSPSRKLPAGLYVVRFQADGQVVTRRVCLVH